MVGPHTAPGTALVIVWDADQLSDYLPLVRPEMRQHFLEFARIEGDLPFDVGDRLTLAEIVPDQGYLICGYLVRVCEFDGLYHPKHFDVAALPECLTRLLVPQREDA